MHLTDGHAGADGCCLVLSPPGAGRQASALVPGHPPRWWVSDTPGSLTPCSLMPHGGFPPPAPRAGVVGIPVGGHHRLCHAGWLSVLSPPCSPRRTDGRCLTEPVAGELPMGAPAALARSTATELFLGSPQRPFLQPPSGKRAPCINGGFPLPQ